LLAFLRQTKRIKPAARTPDSVIDRLVRKYDAYLNDVAGLAFETRFYRRRYAREFLQSRLRRGRIQLTGLSPKILRRYIQRRAPGLKPASLRILATSLRSFFRFLHFTGRGKSHLGTSHLAAGGVAAFNTAIGSFAAAVSRLSPYF
jgi:hypothetical protein